MLGEGVGVDAGVGGDGPFRGCVVGLQPVVEASVVSSASMPTSRSAGTVIVAQSWPRVHTMEAWSASGTIMGPIR
jgi:hypothetical protein